MRQVKLRYYICCQIDEEEIDEKYLKINLTYVSTSLIEAKNELLQYYLNNFNVKNEDIKYDENQDVRIYDDDDNCYNNGDHWEFEFTVFVDRNFNEDELK